MPNHDLLITNTKKFVKSTLTSAEGGHDWFHVERVFHTAVHIAKQEGIPLLVVKLGALLHDIGDSKFHNGDETIGPKLALEFLDTQPIAFQDKVHIINIIKHISFKNSFDTATFESRELEVVRDADRLDAMGAIGIARCFNYGGFKNRQLYNPDIAPVTKHNKSSYKNSKAPTLNHFYEKLLLLKGLMHTKTAKILAEERHEFMVAYLEQFKKEWHLEF